MFKLIESVVTTFFNILDFIINIIKSLFAYVNYMVGTSLLAIDVLTLLPTMIIGPFVIVLLAYIIHVIYHFIRG